MLNKFSKFFVIAVINGVLNGVLLWFFTSVLNIWYIWSALLTIIILVPIGFTVNSLWTWKNKKRQVKEITTIYRFLKYNIVGGITVILGFASLFIATDIFHMWYLLSYIVASVFVIIGTFLAHYFWTWGNSENKELDFVIDILRKTKLIRIAEKLGVKC
jgi:putative flippase GtrA